MHDIVFWNDPTGLESSAVAWGVSRYLIAKSFESVAELKSFKEKLSSYPHVGVCWLVSQKDASRIASGKAYADAIAAWGGNLAANQWALNAKGLHYLFFAPQTQRLEVDAGLAQASRQQNCPAVFFWNDLMDAFQDENNGVENSQRKFLRSTASRRESSYSPDGSAHQAKLVEWVNRLQGLGATWQGVGGVVHCFSGAQKLSELRNPRDLSC
ncbi:MAG: hypothetical protein HY917_00255, partial [Candidatus Diapherotrites archaeon]|nr:hypothetical protein [Candidatus Diapherotrites archaeon]